MPFRGGCRLTRTSWFSISPPAQSEDLPPVAATRKQGGGAQTWCMDAGRRPRKHLRPNHKLSTLRVCGRGPQRSRRRRSVVVVQWTFKHIHINISNSSACTPKRVMFLALINVDHAARCELFIRKELRILAGMLPPKMLWLDSTAVMRSCRPRCSNSPCVCRDAERCTRMDYYTLRGAARNRPRPRRRGGSYSSSEPSESWSVSDSGKRAIKAALAASLAGVLCR